MNLTSQFSGTLKKLDVSYCESLTNSGIFIKKINGLLNNIFKITLNLTGIINSMVQLKKLTCLNVYNIGNVNNSLLEAALNLENNRSIRIECGDTSVNAIEFEEKYPETLKTDIFFDEFEFKFRNLTFLSQLT
jgi:hypothetical protein